MCHLCGVDHPDTGCPVVLSRVGCLDCPDKDAEIERLKGIIEWSLGPDRESDFSYLVGCDADGVVNESNILAFQHEIGQRYRGPMKAL